MHSHKLDPAAASTYIKLGHGTFTLVGQKNRYTFKTSSKNESPIFVSLLTGSDNTSDYNYIGFIPNSHDKLVAGRKGNASHPAFVALDWYLKALRARSPKAELVEFWHEGTCGHCGRKLTTPRSIELGIGPICESKI